MFGSDRQPSYAWSFDRGDGWRNVGYGELLGDARTGPSRRLLLDRLEELLPGAADGRRPVARPPPAAVGGGGWRQPDGPVLLAGDAAGLVNPMTGEGIYYAVATGLLAGRAAARGAGRRATRGRRYPHRRRSAPLLARHLRHTAVAARLSPAGGRRRRAPRRRPPTSGSSTTWSRSAWAAAGSRPGWPRPGPPRAGRRRPAIPRTRE